MIKTNLFWRVKILQNIRIKFWFGIASITHVYIFTYLFKKINFCINLEKWRHLERIELICNGLLV